MSDSRTFGAIEARKRVNESLDLTATERANLNTFINKFAKLEFYKNLDNDFNFVVESHDIVIPDVFRRIRRILASVEYGKNVYFSLAVNKLIASIYDLDTKRFYIDFSGNGLSNYKKDIGRINHLYSSKIISLFPIGGSLEDIDLYLGINLLRGDKRIYMYHGEDIGDASYGEEDISTAIKVVFSDYTQLLASADIVFIQGNDTEVIHASNPPQ